MNPALSVFATLARPIAGAVALSVMGLMPGAGPALAQLQVLESSVPGTGMDGPCATPEFTIAAMPWASGEILAHIHAQLIEAELGCRVRVMAGDAAGTLAAISATRQPAAAVEVWASRVPDIWNAAAEAGNLRAAGPAYGAGTMEAWFVPDYVMTNNPGLVSATSLRDHWQVFAQAGEETAPFWSCPAEWACAVLNPNLLAGHRLTDRFTVVVPEDRSALDQALAGAVAERRPILSYYWQPNALVAQLDLVPLDMGAVDEDALACAAESVCVPFQPTAFPADIVVNVLASWVFSDAPAVARYFERAQMPLAEMNRLLAWQIEQGADAARVAAHFIATGEAVWSGWTGAGSDG